jgi:hypothetical protein
MDESENTFPMDITDPSSRPWNFRPEGYLVVILAGTEEAERAEAALVEGGFAHRDIKLYTGKQILDNHEVYMGSRGVTSRVVGSVADDVEGRELYLGYAVRIDARCGCAFLTKPMCPRLSGYSPTTTTFTRATTALSSRPTSTSPDAWDLGNQDRGSSSLGRRARLLSLISRWMSRSATCSSIGQRRVHDEGDSPEPVRLT